MASEPQPALLARKKLIKLVEETTSGTHGTCVLLAENYYDVACDPGDFFSEGDRQPDGNYLGRVASVVGKQMGTVKFTLDVRPGGTFLALLTAAGYKSDGGSPPTYKPSSDLSTRKTYSFEVYEDGRKKIVDGASAKVTLELAQGKKLVAKFEFSGIWGGATDSAMPSQAPVTSGPYVCRGLVITVGGVSIAHVANATFDLGAEVEERESLTAAAGIAHFLVGEILPKVSMDPEGRKVADQDAYGLLLAGATAAVSASFPVVGAHTLILSGPAAQRVKVSDGVRGKRLTDPVEFNLCNSSGDDAFALQEV